jgi:hypothetical protein
VAGSDPDESLNFSIDLILPASLWPGVDSASNRNEYQESSWAKGRPARKADNLIAICEPIILKLWKSRRLKTLWTSTAGYRDSFTFFTFIRKEIAENICLIRFEGVEYSRYKNVRLLCHPALDFKS